MPSFRTVLQVAAYKQEEENPAEGPTPSLA